MAEPTAEQLEAAEEAAFELAMGDTSTESAEGSQSSEGAASETVAESPAAGGGEAPVDEIVQLKKSDFETLMGMKSAIETMKADNQKNFDKVFGKVGGVERLTKELQDIQNRTPAGANIEITDEDVAEMAGNFPELAGNLKAALIKVAKKMKGTGTVSQAFAAAAPVAPVRTVESPKPADRSPSQEAINIAVEDLDDWHPKWREITAPKADSPYRKWLATQPAEYQTKVNDSYSAGVIGRSIDKFQAATKKAPKAVMKPVATVQTNRIRNAVNPRGAGGTPQRMPDTEEAGFNSVFAGKG